jgi:cellobiose-specific phosphotransferase system component IIC
LSSSSFFPMTMMMWEFCCWIWTIPLACKNIPRLVAVTWITVIHRLSYILYAAFRGHSTIPHPLHCHLQHFYSFFVSVFAVIIVGILVGIVWWFIVHRVLVLVPKRPDQFHSLLFDNGDLCTSPAMVPVR